MLERACLTFNAIPNIQINYLLNDEFVGVSQNATKLFATKMIGFGSNIVANGNDPHQTIQIEVNEIPMKEIENGKAKHLPRSQCISSMGYPATGHFKCNISPDTAVTLGIRRMYGKPESEPTIISVLINFRALITTCCTFIYFLFISSVERNNTKCSHHKINCSCLASATFRHLMIAYIN